MEKMDDKVYEHLRKNEPFTFAKYGDGEYCAMFPEISWSHCNCDGDTYTDKLGQFLKESFACRDQNNHPVYIGKWPVLHQPVEDFIEKNCGKINWVDYSLVAITSNDDHNAKMIEIYKLIQQLEPLRKNRILISNDAMIKANLILKTNYFIRIPFRNWFDSVFTGDTPDARPNDILDKVDQIISDPTGKSLMVFTACGMSSKVILTQLKNKYPDGIFIDIGSALDFICTHCNTRGAVQTDALEYIYKYFEPVLPVGWHDYEFNSELHSIAKSNLIYH